MTKRRLVGVTVALIVAVLVLPRLPPVRTLVITAALVPEFIRLGPAPLSLATTEPTRTTTTYGSPADRMDVYLPGGTSASSRLPAVVLALGVHPQPIDHPDIAGLATAIARAGVAVSVPDSTALRNLRVTPAEPGHLADAFMTLSSRAEVDAQRVGLAGFSAGASIALVAAADDRIAGELRYVSAFGGYADAETLLLDVASGSMVIDGEVVDWLPDEGIRRDLRTLLTAAINDPQLAEGFFMAADRASASRLLRLLAPIRADLAAISPLSHVDRIAAPVSLLHGDADTAIPISHALLLDEALGDRVARFTRFGRFGHGQPGESGLALDDTPDLWALLLHLHDIVAATTE